MFWHILATLACDRLVTLAFVIVSARAMSAIFFSVRIVKIGQQLAKWQQVLCLKSDNFTIEGAHF